MVCWVKFWNKKIILWGKLGYLKGIFYLKVIYKVFNKNIKWYRYIRWYLDKDILYSIDLNGISYKLYRGLLIEYFIFDN